MRMDDGPGIVGGVEKAAFHPTAGVERNVRVGRQSPPLGRVVPFAVVAAVTRRSSIAAFLSRAFQRAASGV